MLSEYDYISQPYDSILKEVYNTLALEAEGDSAPAATATVQTTQATTDNTGGTPTNNTNVKDLNVNAKQQAKKDSNSDPNATAENKKKKDENFFNSIDKFIDKIIKALTVLTTKLSNRLSYSLNSDASFEKALNAQMTKVKPLDNVTVTTFEYHLDGTINKQITAFLNTVRSVMEWEAKAPAQSTNTAPSTASNADLIQNIERSSNDDAWLQIFQSIPIIPKDKNITNPDKFADYLIKEFRKDKVRMNFKGGANIPKYRAIATSMKQYSTNIKNWIESAKKIKEGAEKFDSKHKMNTSQLSPQDDLEYKEKIKKRIGLVANLFSGYSRITNQYFEMRLEYSRNYQIILKAFYGF